ncbi:MAG: hypothetical protein K2O23_03895, partial [Anaeroplasmataceae bacterium]|nr:hypothetical protein [Anaeroplasmataceae bacterium]
MKKKILLLIFVLVSLLWMAIPSQAANGLPVINERDTEIFGLLPMKQNDSLSWEHLDLNCKVNYTSKDHEFFNEAIATYQIRNRDWGRSVKEEFVLPYFELENSRDFKLDRTSIVVDGEEITPTLRHASALSGMEFYYNKEIPLYEDYNTNEKFNTNTSVHKIVAKADVSNLKDNASLQFDVNVKRADGTIMAAKNLKSMTKDKDDIYTLTFSVNNKSSAFELYFIGEMSEFTIHNYENLTIEETDGNLLSFANFQLPENISLTD